LQEVGNAYPLARTWFSLAQWHKAQSNPAEARTCLERCIPIFREMDALMDLDMASQWLTSL
jgi:hypothetical protein